ncbi:putative peptidase YgaJ [Puia dinghuensis]|uniref:Putative peptidase YgaJ n=2 Tax=Puia dinghuensis TaxID=1792502 RepID=A0A8J2U764_9BACT|nr:putative peptidase YgaJ [Puia dinghuensis]
MGGGGFSMEPDNPLLDAYVVAQARKKNPAVCFFPHATDDATRYALNFFKAFSRLDARPAFLSLFTPPTADLESYLLEQDVIYVGGGNTRNMLALWREWGLDKILQKAYAEGVVLAGISAGANCWFEECSTDSVPGKLSVLACLGILKGSFCPHYDGEAERRPTLHQFHLTGQMKAGYAADDGAAGHFIDDVFSGGVSSRPWAKVYGLRLEDGSVVEEVLPTRFLGV